MLGLAMFFQQVGHNVGFHLALAIRLYAGTTLGPLEAAQHVQAASAAATDDVGADLLLGVAFVESRFDPRWVSRVEGGKRVYGLVLTDTPPRRLDKRKSLYCGPLQTHAPTWEHCLQQRDDLHVAYRASASELTSWLRDRRVRGAIPRARAGYGCGNHGVRTGKCNRYPGRVLYQARRFAGEINADHRAARPSRAKSRSGV